MLGVFLLFASLNAIKDWRTVTPATNVISVSGKGEAVTVPDIATFSFTVSADAKAVTDAQSTVTTKMNVILQALKKQNIEDKDIKTTDYSVSPKYTYVQSSCLNGYCNPRQVADGYTVSHTVLVKIRKTEEAGKALSSVGDNGATSVSGLNFTNDDPNKALNEARAEAIDDARVKAEALADHLGVSLVRVVGYSDNSVYPYPSYGMGGDSASPMMLKSEVVAPTLPTGENKVTANVTVNYEIR